MKSAIVALLLLSGCHYTLPWETADLPADIYFDASISDDRMQEILLGAAYWNNNVPGLIRTLLITSNPPECGILVREGAPLRGLADTTTNIGCRTTVTISPELQTERLRRAVIHELGHAFLGAEHHPADGNVIEHGSTGWDPDPTIAPEQLQSIRERM